MAQFDVNNNSVETILNWIKSEEIAIPEMQRPFVWNSSKVRDLIDSLYQGYPCGYIIVWKNPDVKLKDGSVSNGKKVLIDGQQRITALQSALVGTSVIANNYKKKRIKIAFNPIEEKFEVCNSAIEKDSYWIDDISNIFDTEFSSFDYDIKKFTTNDPMSYLKTIEDGELSVAFWENIIIGKLDTSVASSPMFHMFIISQIKSGNKGFLSEQIDIKSLVEQRGDIHHIFPKNYLKSNGITSKTDYNQIANYVYTQSEINIKIKDKAPKFYMQQVNEQCNTKEMSYGGITDYQKLLDNLNENCIPNNIINMEVEDYQDFLEQRRKLIAKKIKDFYFSL